MALSLVFLLAVTACEGGHVLEPAIVDVATASPSDASLNLETVSTFLRREGFQELSSTYAADSPEQRLRRLPPEIPSTSASRSLEHDFLDASRHIHVIWEDYSDGNASTRNCNVAPFNTGFIEIKIFDEQQPGFGPGALMFFNKSLERLQASKIGEVMVVCAPRPVDDDQMRRIKINDAIVRILNWIFVATIALAVSGYFSWRVLKELRKPRWVLRLLFLVVNVWLNAATFSGNDYLHCFTKCSLFPLV